MIMPGRGRRRDDDCEPGRFFFRLPPLVTVLETESAAVRGTRGTPGAATATVNSESDMKSAGFCGHENPAERVG